MGLYDSIHIEYPDMPMPENATTKEQAYLKQSISADTFQTKDFYACLDHYLIDQYGRFFSLNVSEFDQTINKQEYIQKVKDSFKEEFNINLTDKEIINITNEGE